jgi:hypothetical protein
MSDIRIIFKEELIKIGILANDATVIALDIGSSQVAVNNEYFEDFNYSENVKKTALVLTGKFYSGELSEEIE